MIAAAGDIACPGAPCEADRAVAQLVARIDPSLVLVLGDNQYKSGALAEFEASFDRTWGAFKSRTYPVPGNHEYRTAGASGYFDYFGARASPGTDGDYSIDVAGWHIVGLNSAIEGAFSTHQLDWLRDDLRHAKSRCELTFWHHPRWSSGAVEGSDPMPQLEPLWAILHEEGVDVVLNGHAHQYERFAPLDDSGLIDERTGVRGFVVGTGGATPHPFDEPPVSGSRVRITEVFGALELLLRPSSYDWRFVSVDGLVLDHGSGRCH